MPYLCCDDLLLPVSPKWRVVYLLCAMLVMSRWSCGRSRGISDTATQGQYLLPSLERRGISGGARHRDR